MKEIIENLYLSDVLLSGNDFNILKDLNIERIVAAFKGDLPGYPVCICLYNLFN